MLNRNTQSCEVGPPARSAGGLAGLSRPDDVEFAAKRRVRGKPRAPWSLRHNARIGPPIALALLCALPVFAAESANLGFSWVTDADIETLLSQPDLRRLDLSLSLITDAGMARLKALRNVTVLNLFAVEHITDAAIASIRGWEKLERLNLRGTDITDTSLRYVGGMTSLRSLDVSGTQITNNGMEYLANLRDLEELRIGGNKVTGSGLHILKTLPRLRTLSLNGSQKRNSGTWAASLNDNDMDTIASLSRLEWLDLGGVKVTDLGASKLKGLASLRVLDLSRTLVSAVGLEGFENLERLSLWRAARIDDTAAVPLARMKKLASLDLSETKITETGAAAIAHANPNCKVVWK